MKQCLTTLLTKTTIKDFIGKYRRLNSWANLTLLISRRLGLLSNQRSDKDNTEYKKLFWQDTKSCGFFLCVCVSGSYNHTY